MLLSIALARKRYLDFRLKKYRLINLNLGRESDIRIVPVYRTVSDIAGMSSTRVFDSEREDVCQHQKENEHILYK